MLALVGKGRIKGAGNMRIPILQQKRPPEISVHVFLVTALLFLWGVSNVSAKPRPLSPPWPSFGLLQREGFDEPFGFATNQVIDPAIWAESWSGWALNRQGKVVEPWVVPMVVSNSFRVEPERGAIRLWYRPDFGSAAGAGQTATLVELVSAKGNTETVWWALVVAPEGNEIHLICQTESGPTTCLSAEVKWEAGTWHLLTLGFTPTNSALFIDDQLAAVGEGLATVPKEVAPLTSLVVGSSYSGTEPAQGQIEELCVFSGRKKIQQVMGNVFGLSVDWEIGIYYSSLSKTAALGPISDEEIAARQERAAKIKAERAALGLDDESGGGVQMLRLVGGTSECVTNRPLYITNTVCVFATNQGWTVQFDVQGTNSPADIFTTTNLSGNNITNSQWTWLERGPSCSTYQYTNQPTNQSFYILGTMLDSDGDSLTDAYEKLVSHTDPLVWTSLDTDGDGLSDAWEMAHGYDPANPDSNHNGIPDGYEDFDGDGLANKMEAVFACDPGIANPEWKMDSDGDGIPDSLDANPNVAETAPTLPIFDKCPLP